MRLIWVLCMAFALVALPGCEMRQGSSERLNLTIGDPIPAFSLKDLDGNIVSSKELLGKPYVVAVFATWCPPCKMELASYEKDVWQPLKESGVGVIGINYGDEDADMIRKFAGDIGVSFPLLTDLDGSFRKIAGVTAIPQSIVVGADGLIVNLHMGFTDESIVATVKELKAEL